VRPSVAAGATALTSGASAATAETESFGLEEGEGEGDRGKVLTETKDLAAWEGQALPCLGPAKERESREEGFLQRQWIAMAPAADDGAPASSSSSSSSSPVGLLLLLLLFFCFLGLFFPLFFYPKMMMSLSKTDAFTL
jgi:hypothetical protein